MTSPPIPQKVCKVFESSTLGLDFRCISGCGLWLGAIFWEVLLSTWAGLPAGEG
jgi:hypothetical protein